jgi:centromere protein S
VLLITRRNEALGEIMRDFVEKEKAEREKEKGTKKKGKGTIVNGRWGKSAETG